MILTRNQKGRTAAGDIDLAVVDYFGGGRRCVKGPGAAAGKIERRGGSGGHDQAMGGDGGLAANREAVRILQHHIAVGVEVPVDAGGIGIVDIIPGRPRKTKAGRRSWSRRQPILKLSS